MAEKRSEQPPAPESPVPEPARRRRTWIWIAVAVVTVLGVVLVRRVKGSGNQQPGAVSQARAVPVGVSAAEKRDVQIWVEGLGNVTSLATVTVRARVSGQIVSIAFQEGSRVKQGELLVQLDPRPFRIALQQAEATTQRDAATLKNAELDLLRYTELSKQKLIAPQQLDQQRSLVDQSRATVALDQAAVNNARLNLQFTSVTSPIDGVAGVRAVDVGNLVSPTDANGIVVLTQMDPIAVLFTLPQDDLPRVAAAFSKGALAVEAWDRGGVGKLGTGKLTVIDNQVNAGTATIRLKAEFPNPDLRLWPSLFVKARLQLQTREGVVVVPTPAIQRGPNGVFVYVVNADSTVAVRNVQVDTVQGPITIVTQGVQPGDRVVVDGQNQLRAGAKVDPRPVSTPGAPAQGAAPQAVEQPPPQPAAQHPPASPRQQRQQPQGRPGQQGGAREASVQ